MRAGRLPLPRIRAFWLSWLVRTLIASIAACCFFEEAETPRFQVPRQPGPGFAPSFDGSGTISHCSGLIVVSGLYNSPAFENQRRIIATLPVRKRLITSA